MEGYDRPTTLELPVWLLSPEYRIDPRPKDYSIYSELTVEAAFGHVSVCPLSFKFHLYPAPYSSSKRILIIVDKSFHSCLLFIIILFYL